MAIRASEMAGAISERDAEDSPPRVEKVSKIPITVPKSPINGEVEAMMESQVSPLVETLMASEAAASNMALLGVETLER